MRPRPALATSAALTALALALTPSTASALIADPTDPPVVTDAHAGAFDARAEVEGAVGPTKAQLDAVAAVVTAAAGARVTWDRRFGTPPPCSPPGAISPAPPPAPPPSAPAPG